MAIGGVYRRFFSLCLVLYLVALLSSMAAMEAFGWLTVLTYLTGNLLDLAPKPMTYRLPPLQWLAALFVVAMISALANRLSSDDTLKIVVSLRWMAFFYLLYLALQSVPNAIFVRWLPRFLWGATAVALFAILQHFTGIDVIRGHSHHPYGAYWRVTGLFGFPLTYAYSFSMIAAVAFALALKHREQRAKLAILTLQFCLIAASIVMSYTRGAWISLTLGCAVIAALVGGPVLKRFALSGMALAVALLTLSDSIRRRFLSLFDLNFYSNSERFEIWRANLQIFFDHPFFGIGYGRNDFLANDYFQSLGFGRNFLGHAHSNYLQMLAGLGFFGLVFYLLFIISLLMISLRLYKRIPSDHTMTKGFALGAIGAQVSLHIGGLTECNFKDMEVNHLFLFMMVMVMVLANRYQVPLALRPRPRRKTT